MTFLQAFFTGKLFDSDNLAVAIYRPIQFFPLQYGNGIMKMEMNTLMSPIFKAPIIYGHSGSTGSFAFYAPEYNVYIVGSINTTEVNPYQYILSYIDAMK